MFKNETKVILNEGKIASESGAVVLVKTTNSKVLDTQKIAASFLMLVLVIGLSLQTGFIINANAEEGPITSPVTSEESPVTAPEVSPSPSVEPSAPSNPSNDRNNGGGGGGGSNNGGGGAPSCNNEAPKAPRILSAVTSGKGQITLNWEKPQGPVSHYGISYGLIKGKPLYGITNTGNVTSYTIKGLVNGVTYHFTVNGVNDCTAGAASQEVPVKVGGKYVAPAYTPGPAVSGTSVKNGGNFVSKLMPTQFTPVPSATPTSNSNAQQADNGILSKVANFFKGWF